ncbi:hypothetical protein TNCV_896471 [Trichonephila clavipes]|nr:hypothetical protein TNCV_896471 [Trichonephila clavipes]
MAMTLKRRSFKILVKCCPGTEGHLGGRILVLPNHTDIIKMGRTILLERRQSESVGRRNSRTTFLRSDWPRPFARREVGVEMELGRSENKRPEQRRS